MALLIEGSAGRDVYAEILGKVIRWGTRQSSRNGNVRNLSDVVVHLATPCDALPIGVGRNLSERVAAAEALQLIGGFSDAEWLCRIAPRFNAYREVAFAYDGTEVPFFHGAYGKRIGDQLSTVVKRLQSTPDTRQAVVTLWDPEWDNEPDHLDYPCTVALGWSVNGDRLDARTVMRSNDAWLGLPYDLFQFTQLQLTLCNVLGLEPGRYTHTAWSLHLYEADVARATAVHSPRDVRTPIAPIGGVGRWTHSLTDVRDRAAALAYGNTDELQLTESERWYQRVLDGHTANLGRDQDRDGAGASETKPVQP